MKKFLLLAIALGSTSLFAQAADTQWLTNYEQALKQAKAEHKRVLMDFTGSDWCAWCQKLDREVFELREFKDYASKNFVLLMVDFPQHREQPASEKAQNEKLADKFQIEGYPTIVVLNSNGSKAGEVGYVEGGPKQFLAELEKQAPKR